MEFVTDIALAFIAFGVGRYFRLSKIKENGFKVITITFFETVVSGALITLLMLYVFKLDLSFSLLLGAIASATAPASTIMTIRQYHAKGKFVDVLLQVIATDNAFALIAFSVCLAVVTAIKSSGGISAMLICKPVIYNIASVILGVLFGFLLRLFIRTKTRSQDNRLILAIGMLLTMSGLCAVFDISPLLSCMALGASYINVCNDKELFEQINNFTPPVLSLFFVLSGMRLDISALVGAGLIGISYFLVRIGGKFLGAYIGAVVTRSSDVIRKYFALGLIPQAGLAIGLAILAQRNLAESDGLLLSTIILSSSILYEMIGPV
jgi:Kef-type K+ transport system membrane component KefB